jgi:hypothetical protein
MVVLLLPFCFLHAYSIVFVHIGPTLPDYLPIAVEQARLFNRDCPVYIIGNKKAFQSAPFSFDKSIRCIHCETLKTSKSHETFRAQSKLSRHVLHGFVMFSSERFFYLEELMRQYALEDVFHLENDVMLYADLKNLLPTFHTHYAGKIGATFDNETRCIPGFVYISTLKPITQLVQFMAEKAKAAKNDMEILLAFKIKCDRLYIDHLPIVMPDYPLKNALGEGAKHKERFSQHFTEFQSIFDAAALGQYLGGVSPRNTAQPTPGFINESCLFNPSVFSYDWKRDAEHRLVPFILYQGAEYPINNLHIHSKNLTPFFSGRACL